MLISVIASKVNEGTNSLQKSLKNCVFEIFLFVCFPYKCHLLFPGFVEKFHITPVLLIIETLSWLLFSFIIWLKEGNQSKKWYWFNFHVDYMRGEQIYYFRHISRTLNISIWGFRDFFLLFYEAARISYNVIKRFIAIEEKIKFCTQYITRKLTNIFFNEP